MSHAFNKAIIPHYKVFTQFSSLRWTYTAPTAPDPFQYETHICPTDSIAEVQWGLPLPHTPLIDLGLLWFIHCDSLRFMGHIGPHQLNCALCASCLPHVTVGVLFVFFLSSCSKDHSLPKPATIDLWTVQLYVSSSGLNILNILNTGSIMFHLFENCLKVV